MRAFKFLLIGLGVLFILISLGMFGARRSADNSTFACDTAEAKMKELENVQRRYEEAKAAGKPATEVAEYLSKVYLAKQSADTWSDSCAQYQSSKRFWRMIIILLGVLGIVMLSVGFIIGRKKTI